MFVSGPVATQYRHVAQLNRFAPGHVTPDAFVRGGFERDS